LHYVNWGEDSFFITNNLGCGDGFFNAIALLIDLSESDRSFVYIHKPEA
jgi:hypothetical protein